MIESRIAPATLFAALFLFPGPRAEAQKPGDPCCAIVTMDARSGIVTAKVNATRTVFQFKLNGYSAIDRVRTNPANWAGLKPGQPVYANFTNNQVSLDGQRVCCTIIIGPGSWATKAGMPTVRGATVGGVVNGIVYVVGGSALFSKGLATVEAYNPATNTWTAKADMPTGRSGAAGGVVNGILYVAGGVGGGLASPTVLEATVDAYNPATNIWWTTKAPMLTAREGAAGGVVNGILYVAGGLDNRTAPVTTVEAYNPVTDRWMTRAPMPTARSEAASGVVNGILYVAGGSGVNRTGPVTTVEAYNPATNIWTTKAPMPIALFDATSGVVDGILYVVGGRSPSNGASSAVEAYDPVTDAWTTGAAVAIAEHIRPASGVVNGFLYVVGGAGIGGNTVEAFHP